MSRVNRPQWDDEHIQALRHHLGLTQRELAERLGTRQIVWESLQRISPGARDALILRYYEGLPYTEIAAALGCSPGAARARVAHGKTQLRRLLAAPEEEAACEWGLHIQRRWGER